MSLSFGLNTKSKAPPSPPPTKKRPTALASLDDDSDDEAPTAAPKSNVFEEELTEFDASNPPSRALPQPTPKKKAPQKLKPGVAPSRPPVRKPQTGAEFGDLSAQRESAAYAKAAKDLDPSIYDYDSFHNAASAAATERKAASKQESQTQGPKYMNALLSAAAQRKQDQQIAKEKLLQREREAEGDEFADKEQFVTGAYKAQQEENQRLREEEEKKKAEEEERRRKGGGGMQGFYKNVMADSERRHQEAMEAAAEMEKRGVDVSLQEEEGKDEKDRVAELAAKGINITLNDEGQVADKRQLLTAGLNVVATPAKPASSSSTSTQQNAYTRQNEQAQSAMARNRKEGVRERQSRMMQEQLEQTRKRQLEQDEQEKERLERVSKSKKTEGDISSARERFLARKRERELAGK